TFPARFINRMPQTVRAWVFSLALKRRTPPYYSAYRGVLAYEKLMDESGKPMHKSLGNAIWFDEAAARMGADVVRWLYCGQNTLANLNFGYGPAEEAKRRLMTLWNVYGFYVLYAETDHFVPRSIATPTPQP